MNETELIIHASKLQAIIDANEEQIEMIDFLIKDLQKFADFRRERIELARSIAI